MPRLMVRPAAQTAAGVLAALSSEQLGREWFDSIASDESEIDGLMWRVNAERATAEMMSQRGKPF